MTVLCCLRWIPVDFQAVGFQIGFYANHEINPLSHDYKPTCTETAMCLTRAFSILSTSIMLSVIITADPMMDGGSTGVKIPEFQRFSKTRTLKAHSPGF